MLSHKPRLIHLVLVWIRPSRGRSAVRSTAGGRGITRWIRCGRRYSDHSIGSNMSNLTGHLRLSPGISVAKTAA
ncbi:hypothetical protein FB567DRAFT_538450 [Paraphoma chrysanthemicola]|uniref:Uncharacterized protein n=1 Tax=Paraphoma chrysanthemicola TaxID=798071 RepID=A0A8K0QTK9_9PLEO|nr:hypothetical protein FB567DRAFT_538450 [Paraphoma chrysanthemicola]